MAATMQLKKLEDAAKKGVADAQAILTAAQEDGRGPEALTADEKKKIDLHMKEYDEAKADMDRVAAVLNAKPDVPAADDPAVRKSVLAALGLESAQADPEAAKMAMYSRAFKKALHRTKDTVALKSLMSDEEYKVLSSIAAIDGGLAISEDMRTQMITKMRDRVYIRSRATVISTNKAQVGFPAWDYEGDVAVTLEGETVTPQDITDILGKSVFTPHKRSAIFKVPEELIDDADYDVAALLTDHFAMRFSEIEENDFLNGDGVKQAYGILNAPITGVDIIGSSTTIAPEDVVGLPYHIRAVYRSNGAYMMNRRILREIRLLRTNEQGANTGSFLWQPSFVAGQPPTLNGFPLIESEFFPDAITSGADGDPLMLFGDWAHYWIVDRKSLSVQQLMEKYIDEGRIGIRLVARFDGAPVRLDPWVRLNRK